MATSMVVPRVWVLQESAFSTQNHLKCLIPFRLLHEGLNGPKAIKEEVKHQNRL